MLMDVYQDRLENGLHIPTARQIAIKLWDAIDSTYPDTTAIEFGSPDWKMLANLNTDVYRFSAAKNWQMNKELTSLITDEDGNVLSFGSFRALAAPVVNIYMDTWLRAEYNHAVAQSMMSAKWVDITANEKTFPYLQYETVGDGRVRITHQELDGVVKPVDDIFWRTYYPPNGWNCRCDVMQLTDAQPSAQEYTGEGIDPLFAQNYAQEGKAFPSDHPYYRGVPKAALSALFDFTFDAADYTLVEEFENGGKVLMSKLVNPNESNFDIMTRDFTAIAEKYGAIVEILPYLQSMDPRRKYLLKGVKKNKTPDARIDGVYADHVVATKGTWDNFDNAVGKKWRQANIAVVRVRDGFHVDIDRILGKCYKRGRSVFVMTKDDIIRIPE